MGPMFFTVKESYRTRIMQRLNEKTKKDQMEEQMKVSYHFITNIQLNIINE